VGSASSVVAPGFASLRLCDSSVGLDGRPGLFRAGLLGVAMPLRMRVHDRESIGVALRRFKKLIERSGLQKELRKRRHYEKPCEVRRRAKMRKQSAAAKALARAAGK